MKVTKEISEFGKYADLEQAEKVCSLIGGKHWQEFPDDDADHNQFFQFFERWWNMLNEETQAFAYRFATSGSRYTTGSSDENIKESLRKLTHDIVWETDIMEGYNDEVNQFIDWVTEKQASGDVIQSMIKRLKELSYQFIKENGLDKTRVKIQYTGEIEITGDDIQDVVDQFKRLVPEELEVDVTSAQDQRGGDWKDAFK